MALSQEAPLPHTGCPEPHCVYCGEHGTPDRPVEVDGELNAYFHADCRRELN
jgi:hypothetical protein